MAMANIPLKKKDVKRTLTGLRQALGETAKQTMTFKFKDLGKPKKQGLRQVK